VTIKCGVQLWDGLRVEDDCFIGPNATFTNDRVPRSKRYPAEFPKTVLKRGASIGANATILPGLTIGAWALVGAGAVVTKNVADHVVVMGNPAKTAGWVCKCGKRVKRKEDLAGAGCDCGFQLAIA
jgi:acetyltransferase-like isoleucine patch superfamily enzyme